MKYLRKSGNKKGMVFRPCLLKYLSGIQNSGAGILPLVNFKFGRSKTPELVIREGSLLHGEHLEPGKTLKCTERGNALGLGDVQGLKL